MPNRNIYPAAPPLRGIKDPTVLDHLRKIWEYVNVTRGRIGEGGNRYVTVAELADLRRMLQKPANANTGYRASTLNGGDGAPSDAEPVDPTSGAPVDATYVLTSHATLLPQHRKLTAGVGMLLEDTGAGGSVSVNARLIDVLGNRFVRWAQPNNNSGAVIDRMGQPLTVGSIAPITATRIGQVVRQLYSVPAVADRVINAVSQVSPASDCYWRGTDGLGGFYMRWIFGIETVSPTQRWCVGMRANAHVTLTGAQVISDLTSCIMIGAEEGDAAISVMCNDSADVCTKSSLGSDFPADVAGVVYALDIQCLPSAASISWQLHRVDGLTATGTFDVANMPAATTFITPFIFLCNGPTAAAAALAFMYIGTDMPFLPEET